MKSPFPGMDPYLEKRWGDLHTRLLLYSCDAIQPELPGGLFAQVQQRVYIQNDGVRERSIGPDLSVLETPETNTTATAVLGDVIVAEPYLLQFDDEPTTENFIEIIDGDNKVITTVEFLSPSNKTAGDGQRLYLRKVRNLQDAAVSLVEIDLVRTGQNGLSISPHQFPSRLSAPYHIVVRRGWVWSKAEVYPVALRQPLPAFRVPLRESDADIILKLQAVLEKAYALGRYDMIDYQRDPDPPLDGDDAVWADALLRAAGRRK